MGVLYRAHAGEIAHLQLSRVSDHIDVFVSHKSEDVKVAERVADCISSCGLTAWVDVLDSHIQKDGPDLAKYIESTVGRCSRLLAVVSGATKKSWWVPFEIGLAYQQRKQLATYCENPSTTPIPSFLWQWPLACSLGELRVWCEDASDIYKVALAAQSFRPVNPDAAYRSSLSRTRDRLRARRLSS